jgi:hypothetical protein
VGRTNCCTSGAQTAGFPESTQGGRSGKASTPSWNVQLKKSGEVAYGKWAPLPLVDHACHMPSSVWRIDGSGKSTSITGTASACRLERMFRREEVKALEAKRHSIVPASQRDEVMVATKKAVLYKQILWTDRRNQVKTCDIVEGLKMSDRHLETNEKSAQLTA